MPEFIKARHIAENAIEQRDYQERLAGLVKDNNLLVVAPTAMGKTIIAVLSIASFLDSGKRIVFLAPTKPLAEQHAVSLKKFLDFSGLEGKKWAEHISVLTGETPPEKRKAVWQDSLIVCCTPQT